MAQGDLLALLADASEDDRVTDAQVAPVGGDAVGDLRGELARRRQDERADAGRGSGGGGGEVLQDREHERRGLARAGLRAGEDVTPLEGARDDLDLDGRRLRVLLLEDRPHEGRREAERRERRGGDGLLDLGRHRRGARRLDAEGPRSRGRGRCGRGRGWGVTGNDDGNGGNSIRT